MRWMRLQWLTERKVRKVERESAADVTVGRRAPGWTGLAILALGSLGFSSDREGNSPQGAGKGMKRIDRAQLCVTDGEVEKGKGEELLVTVPQMRAFVMEQTEQIVEARFKYIGPTAKSALLASGQMRRQFGLKLRAEDGCNLVYVMWRFQPKSEIVVSVKSNPGQHESSECGNHGYHDIKPRRSIRVPEIKDGSSHTLRAEMNGDEMKVILDGEVAWEGNVGSLANGIEGPVGMRSDNAHVEVALFAGEADAKKEFKMPSCRKGSE